MRPLVASELRRLHRKVAQVDRRLALVELPGKVVPGSQDLEKRTVRLEIGESADGRKVISPPVRWQQPGAGKLKTHAVPADNEQMVLRSPSGTIGSGSHADWGTYDDDTPPPSEKADETVTEYGETRTTIRDDEHRTKTPRAVVESDDVNLGGEDGPRVARIGDLVHVQAGSSAGHWPIVTGSEKVKAK